MATVLAAVPTGMSAAFREISTLTLPDSAVDAAIAPHNYTGNVSRICGGLMRARSEGQLRIVVLGTSMAAGAGLVGKERSWPKWLQEDAVKYSGGAFRNATVSFAPGGMSASFVLKLPTMREALHAAHLVIADYSLNDRPTHCLYVKNNKGHELEAARSRLVSTEAEIREQASHVSATAIANNAQQAELRKAHDEANRCRQELVREQKAKDMQAKAIQTLTTEAQNCTTCFGHNSKHQQEQMHQ